MKLVTHFPTLICKLNTSHTYQIKIIHIHIQTSRNYIHLPPPIESQYHSDTLQQNSLLTYDSEQAYHEDDPSFYQGELEGLMRTHPHLVPRRYPDTDYCNEALVGEPSPMDMSGQVPPPRVTIMGAAGSNKKHKRSGSTKSKHHQQSQQLQLQRSYSSSDDELRSTPDCGSCDERDPDKGMLTVLFLSVCEIHSWVQFLCKKQCIKK